MQRLLSYIKNNHRDLLFFLFLIWNCSVFFHARYFPTLDGGPHAYNAKIMASLLFGDGEPHSDYFRMNPEPVPNWLTSGLSMILNSFLSFSVAEKVILLIFFIAFPLLFRMVADSLAEKKSYLIFLVFPLTHYSLLYFGFFNFSYGILVFIVAVLFRIKNRETMTVKKWLLFALICLLLWFSHLFAFLSFLVFLAVYELFLFLSGMFFAESKKPFSIQIRVSLSRAIKVVACVITPLLLTWMYFHNRPPLGNSYRDTKTLNAMMTEGDIFKCAGDARLGVFLFYLFAVLLVYALILKLIKALREKRTSAFFSRNDTFLFMIPVLLFLFYTQADSDGYGGYVSLRLSLFTFLMAALWLAGSKLNKAVEGISALLLVIALILGVKKEGVKWMSSELSKMDEVTDHIREGATVTPVYFANYNWQGVHYSDYLGARKHIIITENFEASTGYFPVIWKSNQQSLYFADAPFVTKQDCLDFAGRLNTYPGGPVEYVFIYGNRPGEAKYETMLAELRKKYKLTYSFENGLLYERNPEK